jgi:hypothetical protein
LLTLKDPQAEFFGSFVPLQFNPPEPEPPDIADPAAKGSRLTSRMGMQEVKP